MAGEFTRCGTRRDWAGADVSLPPTTCEVDGTEWSEVAGGQAYNWHDLRLSVLSDSGGAGLYLWERYGAEIWKLGGGAWQAMGFSAEGGIVSSLAGATIGGSPSIFAGGNNIGVRRRVGAAWVDTGLTDTPRMSLAGYASLGQLLLPRNLASCGGGTASAGRGVLAEGGERGELIVLDGLEAQPLRPHRASWRSGKRRLGPVPAERRDGGPVTSVAIAGGRVRHPLRRSDAGRGTVLTARSAAGTDVDRTAAGPG